MARGESPRERSRPIDAVNCLRFQWPVGVVSRLSRPNHMPGINEAKVGRSQVVAYPEDAAQRVFPQYDSSVAGWAFATRALKKVTIGSAAIASTITWHKRI